MSRDLTPIEMHALDKEYGFSTDKFSFEIDGEKIDLQSKYKNLYPNLGFFLGRRLDPIIDMLRDRYGLGISHHTFDRCEKILDNIIKSYDDKNAKPYEATYPIEEAIDKWYRGRLDPGFYYSEENDRLLEECIKQEASEIDREEFYMDEIRFDKYCAELRGPMRLDKEHHEETVYDIRIFDSWNLNRNVPTKRFYIDATGVKPDFVSDADIEKLLKYPDESILAAEQTYIVKGGEAKQTGSDFKELHQMLNNVVDAFGEYAETLESDDKFWDAVNEMYEAIEGHIVNEDPIPSEELAAYREENRKEKDIAR